MHGNLEASIVAEELVLGGGAPQNTRDIKEPAYISKVNAFNIDTVADITDIAATAKQLIALPNIASKKYVYEQYDSMVGTGNASTNAPSDAAIVIAKPTNKALALTTDCNSRYVYANPYIGAMIAVAEAARNIVCSGGQPLGVTNCLNFGNPYDPEVYWQFSNAIKGMGEACRKFNTPVTGGNVSFYNQSPDGPVYPTPTIGMVGLLNSVDDKMTLDFKQADDEIYIIGTQRNDINCSEYLHKIKGVEDSPAPHFDLEEEYHVQKTITKLISHKLIESAHDVSEGGVLINLLESAFVNNKGFEVSDNNTTLRKDAFWFGEAQSRVVVTVNKAKRNDFIQLLEKMEPIESTFIGKVTDGNVVVNTADFGSVQSWKELYDNAIGGYFK
jgi:phosphoribosylformylglycinamidine synthase subunit PurL